MVTNRICHLQFGLKEGEPSNKQTLGSTSGGPDSHSNREVKQKEVESCSLRAVAMCTSRLSLLNWSWLITAVSFPVSSPVRAARASCRLVPTMQTHPFHIDLGNVVVHDF